jgi:hypothetical protein
MQIHLSKQGMKVLFPQPKMNICSFSLILWFLMLLLFSEVLFPTPAHPPPQKILFAQLFPFFFSDWGGNKNLVFITLLILTYIF